MPACTALGVKSRISVALVGRASAPGSSFGPPVAPQPPSPSATAAISAARCRYLAVIVKSAISPPQADVAGGRTLSGEPVEELYTEADLPAGIGAPRARPDRAPGRVPVHARGVRVDVPRAAVDDAPVRGVRHQRGDQRALPLPARARADRALDRVRHALADGPRLRQPALPRRGRPRGGGGGHAWRTCARCSRASTSARCRCR